MPKEKAARCTPTHLIVLSREVGRPWWSTRNIELTARGGGTRQQDSREALAWMAKSVCQGTSA